VTNEAQIIEALLSIPDKEGNDVEMKLNSAQRALDEAITGRDLVPKARQEGVSSYVLAFFLVCCLMYRNTRAVVISHDRESTQRLLSRVRYYIDNMRGPKPVVQNLSKNEITFPKTNSMFYLGTAGSRKFGRGDTITHLHCSEYAFWPNPKEIMTGLLQAVPKSGVILIESTGNGFNDYHRRCMRAEAGQSLWTNHFLPWHKFDEYSLELTPREEEFVLDTLNEDWEEPDLVKRGLTAGQIAWRRMKLDELDYDLRAFKQEYPMTLDECFQMSSESIFAKVKYEVTDAWKKLGRTSWKLEGHPRKDLTYVLGADVAGGVGKDSSVIEIFCLDTAEQVYEYVSNQVDPAVFAKKIAEAGELFYWPYAVVEQNNHGILTLNELQDLYPGAKLHADPVSQTNSDEKMLFGLGYRTTPRTKPLMIGKLRKLLAREWTIHSILLKSELSTFIEDDKGKLGAQQGCNDDTVMASACAATGYNMAALDGAATDEVVSTWMNSPFLLDNIIKELQARSNKGLPVSWQHRMH